MGVRYNTLGGCRTLCKPLLSLPMVTTPPAAVLPSLQRHKTHTAEYTFPILPSRHPPGAHAHQLKTLPRPPPRAALTLTVG